MNKIRLFYRLNAIRWARRAAQIGIVLAILLASCSAPIDPPPARPLPDPIVQPAGGHDQAPLELSATYQDIQVSNPQPGTPVEMSDVAPAGAQAELVAQRTAHSAVFDMGNGSFALMQDAQPMHYLDKNKQWQRINPTFAEAETGWLATANSVRAGLAQHASSATISANGVSVGWQPREMALVDSNGQTVTLAAAQTESGSSTRSADGHSVVYTDGWSQAGLQDEWRADYGRAEYRMRLAAQPEPKQPSVGEIASLELRVYLHQAPGVTLEVDGRPIAAADLPLETDAGLAFTGNGGEALELQPPQVYEEANPDRRAPGRYALAATDDPSTLELRVRLPWSWLAAEERQYPLVIDPVFQMRTGTLIESRGYDGQWNYRGNDNEKLSLGQFGNGVYRVLAKFAMPTLPPGTSINQAYMIATPTKQWISNREYLVANVVAYQMLDNLWQSNWTDIGYLGGSHVQEISAKTMSFSNGDPNNLNRSAVWDVTSLAQAWRSNPTQNFGVMLRTENEQCKISPNNCGPFILGDGQPYWSDDDLQAIEDNAASAPSLPAAAAGNGGLRLLVLYAPASLGSGETLVASNPNGDYPYFHADHVYRLPMLMGDRWEAVVTTGLGDLHNDPPSQSNPTGYIMRSLQGAASLKLRDAQDSSDLEAGNPQNGQLNYILFNGRRTGAQQYQARIKPLTTTDPTLAPQSYDIRFIAETESLSGVLNTPVSKNYEFDSRQPLALWTINLPEGSNSSVIIDFIGDNTLPTDPNHHYNHVRDFSAQLFEDTTSPSKPYLSVGKSFTPLPDGAPTTGDIPNSTPVVLSADLVPGPDPYVLALAYNGPRVTSLWTKTGGGEFPTYGVAPLHFDYRVRIVSCPPDAIPTQAGTCLKLECPAAAGQEVSGLQVWTGTNIAPMIGRAGDATAHIATDVAPTWDGSGNLSLAKAKVYLVECTTAGSAPSKKFLAYTGAMQHLASSGTPDMLPVGDGVKYVDPWLQGDRDQGDVGNESYYVSAGGPAGGAAHLRRTVGGTELFFNVAYSVTVDGWPSLQSAISQDGATNPPPVGGLLIEANTAAWSLDTKPAGTPTESRPFDAVRAGSDANGETTISQSDSLGGASLPIQAVILPAGVKIPSTPEIACPGNCLDLRALDDAPNLSPPRRQWKMPDIHTNAQASSVVMGSQGELHVWSSDHPAAARSLQAASQEFSFDTFGASVSVAQEPCGSGSPVMVIRGQTQMKLPMVGEGGGPEAFVQAGFKLCESAPGAGDVKLRTVSFAFSSPIGIPVGNSGLFVTGMDGTVEIAPTYTQIQFGLDFQAAQGGGGGVFRGHGDITIDTRGLFDFSGQGKLRVIGTLDAHGHLWVAWNPLDTGFEMSVSYLDWLTGQARAHVWQGQGWQHKYSWLPDNDEKHMAAQISADISIEEGAAFSWWFIDIPPWDITFGIEVAFGQFCTNSACSSYEWGIKGAFSVVGYDVGMYYGFGSGFDFILGNDDHMLIDQYGGLSTASDEQMAAAQAQGIKLRPAAVAANGVSTETFSVSADTESLLFALGWQAGAPQIKILDPHGVDASTGATYTVAVSQTSTSRLIGVQIKQPASGNWRAIISNLTGQEHYKFVYLANKGAPGTPANRGQFIKPGDSDETSNGIYPIQWQVPSEAPVSATISLYYTLWYSRNSTDLALTVYTPTMDMPIVQNWPFKSGAYDWDTAGLKATCRDMDPSCPFCYSPDSKCHYQLRAVVDDGVNDLPAGAVRQSEDSCQPRTELPNVRAFDAKRFPGVSAFLSTGAVLISDTLSPATPSGIVLKGVNGAIIARWNPSPEKDLAAYLVRWGVVRYSLNQWIWTSDYNEMRVVATLSPTVRLGGLRNGGPDGLMYADGDDADPGWGDADPGWGDADPGWGEHTGSPLLAPPGPGTRSYGVAISAIDVNDNASPLSSIYRATPSGDVAAQIPSAPINLAFENVTSHCDLLLNCSSAARLSWQPGSGPTPTSYRLSYRQLTPEPMVTYTDTTGTAITLSLATGETYSFSVSAANSEGWRSVESESIRRVVSNGRDGDFDGLPDDWETAHSRPRQPSISANGDDDGDGLLNIQELANSTDPWQQDSDQDGFSDWEEIHLNTDPLESLRFPDRQIQPRLELDGHRVVFRTKQGIDCTHTSACIDYANVGSGTLELETSASTAWISTTLGYNLMTHQPCVSVRMNTNDLPAGYHTGVVRVNGDDSGDRLIGQTQCIRVEAWVSPADADIPARKIYLPAVFVND